MYDYYEFGSLPLNLTLEYGAVFGCRYVWIVLLLKGFFPPSKDARIAHIRLA